MANDLIIRGISIDTACAEIINKLAAKNVDATPNVRTASGTATIFVDEVENTRKAMSDALMHRAQPCAVKLEGNVFDFRYICMLDMARNCLTLNGEKGNTFSPSEAIKGAISSTDYPNMLNSTVERSIRRPYDVLPAEWKQIGRKQLQKTSVRRQALRLMAN